MHVATPPESVALLPASQLIVEPSPPVIANVTEPVGAPDAIGEPTVVAVIVARAPEVTGGLTVTLVLEVPWLRLCVKVPVEAEKLVSPE